MKNADYRRNKLVGKLKDNVHRQPSEGHKLACGHYAVTNPVVIYPSGRKMYQCPEGCGLQKGRAR
jgi:hypothetical protein